MPRPDAAFARQPQKPGQKLIADFESLKQEADSDAAVEFLSKNKGVVSSMDSEEAFDLLRKMPNRTINQALGEVLQGSLQAVYDRSMKAEPGTDMLEAFQKRGTQTGVAFLEKNLKVVDPEQVADIVATLREIEFSYTEDVNERRKQDAFKKRVEALIQNIDTISPPEAKRDQPKAEMRVVNEEEATAISVAQDRVATLREAFDAYKGDQTEGARLKVERWKKELYNLRGILGEDLGQEVDDLTYQMNDYLSALKGVNEERAIIARAQGERKQENLKNGTARRQESTKGQQPQPNEGILGRIKSLFKR